MLTISYLVSLSQLAWIIAFISCIVSDVEAKFANLSWWAVAYMLLCIVGIVVVVGSNTSHVYGVAVRFFFIARSPPLNTSWTDACRRLWAISPPGCVSPPLPSITWSTMN